MTRAVLFRRAMFADADALAALHAESWRHAYRGVLREQFLDAEVLEDRLAVWRERLTAARGDQGDQFVCLAVTDKQEIVGFVCVFGVDDPKWGSLVDNLHVARSAQGTGIGRALMACAASWVHSSFPTSGLYLWVFEANHAARAFYERLGGVHVETTENPTPGGGSARACRYVWTNLSRLELR